MGTEGSRRCAYVAAVPICRAAPPGANGAICRPYITPPDGQCCHAVLEGHSPVYYANWIGQMRAIREYAYTWHYASASTSFTTRPCVTKAMTSLRHGHALRACAAAALTPGGIRHCVCSLPYGRPGTRFRRPATMDKVGRIWAAAWLSS